MNNNFICFRHNDMDGYCSAAIVMYFLNYRQPDRFIEMNYSSKDEEHLQYIIDHVDVNTDIYIVDYSFTEKTKHLLEALLKKGHKVIWIDHHDSSIELIKKYPELSPRRSDYNIDGIVSKDGSGAYLAYRYFRPNHGVPRFIELVSDYDTFANRIENSCYYKLGIDTYINSKTKNDAYTVFINQLSRLNNDGHKNILTVDSISIINKGKIIKDYIDAENYKDITSYGYESQLEDGTKIYCINRKTNSWVFGEKYNQYDAVVVYIFDGEKYRYTMYSHDNIYDCGKYAESKGGGGHRGAAGFTSTELLFRKVN